MTGEEGAGMTRQLANPEPAPARDVSKDEQFTFGCFMTYRM
jgi:hypothetical protein